MNPRCIVSDRFRFVCVLIPKNASSTLESQLLRPEYQSRRVGASELRSEERDDYTIFAFLRDPVSRLLAGYQEVSLRYEMGESVVDRLPFFEMEDSDARFECFLEAIERGYIDNHIRPQSEFLDSLQIDRYGSVECLDADLREILADLRAGGCPPLPRRRSREGRRKDYGYTRFDIREADLPVGSLDRIRALYAEDFETYHAQIVRPYAHSGRLLSLYRQVNDGLAPGIVYRLGSRGFYAELTTVARTMIYGLANGQSFELDSRAFSYRHKHGWRDYFEPFCSEIESDGAVDDGVNHREICDSEIRGPGTSFDRVRGFRVERIHIGEIPIDGFMNILGAVLASIYRYRPWLAGEINRRIADVGLGDSHATIHLRRGDKIGDEDIHYPTALYVERLLEADCEGLPVFAMSDEHAAVVELRECLEHVAKPRAVASLTEPAHVGFDVFALRREDLHEVGGSGEPASDFRTFIFAEAQRLLVEVEIALRSDLFIGTFYSNVGKSVRFLHQRPERCLLLEPGDVASFAAPPRSSFESSNGESPL